MILIGKAGYILLSATLFAPAFVYFSLSFLWSDHCKVDKPLTLLVPLSALVCSATVLTLPKRSALKQYRTTVAVAFVGVVLVAIFVFFFRKSLGLKKALEKPIKLAYKEKDALECLYRWTVLRVLFCLTYTVLAGAAVVVLFSKSGDSTRKSKTIDFAKFESNLPKSPALPKATNRDRAPSGSFEGGEVVRREFKREVVKYDF